MLSTHRSLQKKREESSSKQKTQKRIHCWLLVLSNSSGMRSKSQNLDTNTASRHEQRFVHEDYGSLGWGQAQLRVISSDFTWGFNFPPFTNDFKVQTGKRKLKKPKQKENRKALPEFPFWFVLFRSPAFTKRTSISRCGNAETRPFSEKTFFVIFTEIAHVRWKNSEIHFKMTEMSLPPLLLQFLPMRSKA